MFGVTATEWKRRNKDKGNIRDDATLEQLVVLSNLERINAMLIAQNLAAAVRLQQLNKIAILQLKSLFAHQGLRSLQKIDLAKLGK